MLLSQSLLVPGISKHIILRPHVNRHSVLWKWERVPRTAACDFPVPHHTFIPGRTSHRCCSCARGIKVRELVSVSLIFSPPSFSSYTIAPLPHSQTVPAKSQQAPHPQVPASSLSLSLVQTSLSFALDRAISLALALFLSSRRPTQQSGCSLKNTCSSV